MKIAVTLLFAPLIVLFTACGGGSADSSTATTTPITRAGLFFVQHPVNGKIGLVSSGFASNETLGDASLVAKDASGVDIVMTASAHNAGGMFLKLEAATPLTGSSYTLLGTITITTPDAVSAGSIRSVTYAINTPFSLVNVASVDAANPPKAQGTTICFRNHVGVNVDAAKCGHIHETALNSVIYPFHYGSVEWLNGLLSGKVTQAVTGITQTGLTGRDGPLRMVLHTTENSVCTGYVFSSNGLDAVIADTVSLIIRPCYSKDYFVWTRAEQDAIYKKGTDHSADTCAKTTWVPAHSNAGSWVEGRFNTEIITGSAKCLP